MLVAGDIGPTSLTLCFVLASSWERESRNEIEHNRRPQLRTFRAAEELEPLWLVIDSTHVLRGCQIEP